MNIQIAWVVLCISTSVKPEQTLETPYPYEFPNLEDEIRAGRTPFPMQLCHGFKLEEASIDQLQERMSKGLLTAEAIAMCYLQRFYQVDEYLK